MVMGLRIGCGPFALWGVVAVALFRFQVWLVTIQLALNGCVQAKDLSCNDCFFVKIG
jgi:hypothetical protein